MTSLKMSASAMAVMCAFSTQVMAEKYKYEGPRDVIAMNGGDVTLQVDVDGIDNTKKNWLKFAADRDDLKSVKYIVNVNTNAIFDDAIKFKTVSMAKDVVADVQLNVTHAKLTGDIIHQYVPVNVGSPATYYPPSSGNNAKITVGAGASWEGDLKVEADVIEHDKLPGNGFTNKNEVIVTDGGQWTGAATGTAHVKYYIPKTNNESTNKRPSTLKVGEVELSTGSTNVTVTGKDSQWFVNGDSTVDVLTVANGGRVDILKNGKDTTLTIKEDSKVNALYTTNGKLVVDKQLTFTGLSEVGDLTSKNGQINIDNTSLAMSGKADIAKMSFVGNSSIELWDGADVTIGHAKGVTKAYFHEKDLPTVHLNVQKADGCVFLEFDAKSASNQTAEQLVGALNSSYTGVDAVFDIDRGDIIDSIAGTFHGDQASYSEKKNANVLSLDQMTAMTMMQWRSEADDMNQRMGELRNGSALNGAWARTYGGKAKSMWAENEYYGLQVGMDRNIGEGDMGHWVGAALSYTDGDGKYTAGTSDNYTLAFTGYSTWLTQSGSYLDLSAKLGKLHDDFDLGAIKGAYSTQAVALSAEIGHRYPLTEMFFVEPQLAFTYAHVFSEDYKATKCISVSQDSIDSYVARAGLMTGIQLPENKGSMWVRASYLYDFDGESTTLVSRAAEKNVAKQDFGGGWYELGLGATMNITPNLSGYADFEYVAGGEIETPYRCNVGVRYSF